MTIELSAGSPSHSDSEEESQSLLTQEAIKRYKSYKSGKQKAINVKLALRHEQPMRTDHERSLGYRRKQP